MDGSWLRERREEYERDIADTDRLIAEGQMAPCGTAADRLWDALAQRERSLMRLEASLGVRWDGIRYQPRGDA